MAEQEASPAAEPCLEVLVLAKTPSPRELEVLRLLADGLTTDAIARRLYVSESTAKSHRYELFNKLDAVNAAQAVSLGYQLGLLTVEDAPRRVVYVQPGDVLVLADRREEAHRG